MQMLWLLLQPLLQPHGNTSTGAAPASIVAAVETMTKAEEETEREEETGAEARAKVRANANGDRKLFKLSKH